MSTQAARQTPPERPNSNAVPARIGRRAFAAALGAGVCAPRSWAAETYPSRLSRVVVPVGAGGVMDVFARAIAQDLGDAMGQQFIVENKGGAAGQLAADTVAKAVGDPYTLFLGSMGIMAISPHLYPTLPYNVQRDFTPIALCGRQPSALIVNPAVVPVRTVAEFVRWAKAQPAPIPYGSYGSGSVSQIAALMFGQTTSVPLTQIPYRAAPAILTDLLKGDLPIIFDAPGGYVGFLGDNRLRALATTSQQRVSFLPDVPTLDESGLKGFDLAQWYGLYAPRNLPPGVPERLRTELAKILRSKKLQERSLQLWLDVVPDGAAGFAEFHERELARWQNFIRANNIKLDAI